MMNQIRVIGQQMLHDLSTEAKANPRLRKNLNFHTSNTASCHRLLNALEPGTYVQPHRHLSAEKDETLIVVAGKIGVLIFDELGTVTQTVVLQPGTEQFGIHITVATFHSMVALAPGSVFFEAKAGPYIAIAEQERGSWAPAEGESDARAYLQSMLVHFSV